MTTAETELDHNTNFDWNRIQESGKDVVPLSGPGYTGLVNLENMLIIFIVELLKSHAISSFLVPKLVLCSCYLASTMQVVFSTHGFCSRYYKHQTLKTTFDMALADPTVDLNMQLYVGALKRNSEDYDALYNWALVLQESADNISPESSSPSKDALLEEVCKKYEEATRLPYAEERNIEILA